MRGQKRNDCNAQAIGGESVIGRWRAFLLERAAQWGLPDGGTWSCLFSNNYQPHYSSICLLWFHDGDEFPQVVSKLYREPAILEREFRNLTRVHASAPALVPKPLHFGQQDEFWTLWMEGVPGWRIHPKDVSSATLRSLIAMVTSLHSAVLESSSRPNPDRYRQIVTDPLATVARYGDSASVKAGCAGVAAGTSAEWVRSLAVIPQHGDLFFSNVLAHRGQWRVVDWESFGTIDFPFYDVFTLLLSLLRPGGDTPEQWDAALLKHVPGLMASYARALGLSSTDIPLLLPLTLANWFHLQWTDGRQEFCGHMYKTIQHYFEHPDVWARAFLPAQSAEAA